MLTTNYAFGVVGFGSSLVPSPGIKPKSADLFVLSKLLSSVEHEAAEREINAIRPSVRIVLFMIVKFSNILVIILDVFFLVIF